MTPQLPDKYLIKDKLGSGGMADVYLAHNRLDGRDVAIKVPKEAFLDEVGRARFVKEARTWAALEHGAIVRVYSFGAEAETPYIEMQLMTGGSLHDRVQAAVFTPEQALPVIKRIAAALDYAHKKGAVHRDVKPDNVLFDAENNAYLTDFGIVDRVVPEEGDETLLRLTGIGQIPGTPAYVSPEQLLPERADSTRPGSGDIYSLGIVLFEMLTGRVPYGSSSTRGVEQAVKQVTEPIPTIAEFNPNLPDGAQTLINNALAKDPSERYATAVALAVDLERLAAGQSVAPLAPVDGVSDKNPDEESDTPIPPKRQSYAWLVPVLIVLLAAAFLTGRILSANDSGEGASGSTEIETAIPATTSATAATGGESTIEIAAVTPTEESTANHTPDPTPVPETETPNPTPTATSEPTATFTVEPTPVPPPVAVDEIVFESNRDGDYDIYIAHVDGSNVRPLTFNSTDDYNARVSPDGRFIAFTSERDGNNEVYVMDRDGNNQRRLTNDPGSDRLPAWSPDGTEIAFVSSRDGLADIFIVNADGSNLRQVDDTPHREGHISWSESGLVFNASLQRYWQIYRSDADGSNRRALTDSTYDEWSPEWSPDGQWIVYLSERDSRTNHGIYLMRADGSDPSELFNGPDYEWGPAWSADGTQILFTVQASESDEAGASIYIMNVADRSMRRIIGDGSAYPSWAVAISDSENGPREEVPVVIPTPLPTPEPTQAPTPDPTATPVPTPSTTVNCVEVGDRWGPTLWNAYRDRLGCALSGEIRTGAAYQRYQKGLAVWREDVDQVYFLYSNGVYAVFPAAGPEGYFDTPLLKGSFGYLWNTNDAVRSGLGQPAAPEANALNYAVQDFARGTIFYFFENNAFNYVLFDDNNTWTSTQE